MKNRWFILVLAMVLALAVLPMALAEETGATLAADIVWNDPITGEQPGTLMLNPADET